MKYFSEKELRCKGSGIFSLAEGFAEKLDELREAYGKPMVPTSCCRSWKHNQAIGGHRNSSHVFDHPERDFRGTFAIDIFCDDGIKRMEMVQAGLKLGWSVGINKTFVHFDRRTDYLKLPQQVFTY